MSVCGAAGAVGRQCAEPVSRRRRHRGHRQAEQEAAQRRSDYPEHAHGGRWAHAGNQTLNLRSFWMGDKCNLGFFFFKRTVK